MKTFKLKPIFLTLAIAVMVSYSAVAQRVIKGTVYREGKIQAGVTVEAHKTSESMMTSFDGKYEINVPDKCKYLKFTFITESKKLDIENNPSNEIDFSFDGKIPEAEEANESGVILKTDKELMDEKDKDFMSAITLERQFYEQKDYKSSLQHWRKLYKTYPKSTKNIYLHGAAVFEALVEGAKDKKQKDLLIDTLMHIYDKRIKYFDQRGFVLGRQGYDYMKYKINSNEELPDDQRKVILKKGYNYVDESVKLQGIDSEGPVLLLLMQSTRGLFGLGELSKEKVIENYDLVSKIINSVLQKEPTSDTFLKTRDAVDQIFQASGAADCEALISIYTPKFDQISSNLEDLKKLIRLLDRQQCDASPLFAKASEKLYQLEPSPEAAYNMARMYVKADQLDKAQSYYKQAIDSEKDPINLSKYYQEFALLNYSNAPVAKGYLKKAIENNPNAGKPYALLGELYAHNAKLYGEDDYEHSLTYWVAVDYLNKAKKIDPLVADEVNEKINVYSQYFPTKEDIFFHGSEEGKSIQLGGWIGESTIVRAKR